MNTTINQFILGQKFLFDSDNNLLIEQTSKASEPIRLGSNESRILKLLVERPNEVITRHELHEYVWREQGFEVDDSSLTQAISTLRKMLQDPTKSPQFVRTVPKRGYQLIASVDLIPAVDMVLTKPDPVSTLPEETPQKDIVPQVDVTANTVDIKPTSIASSTSSNRTKTTTKSWLVTLFAAILPLFVYFTSTNKEEAFKPISNLQQVEILTPVNHNDLIPWLPKIEQCVNDYIAAHSSDTKPIKAIVTGEKNGQISINFIHSVTHSSENNTIRIFGAPQDLAIRCQ